MSVRLHGNYGSSQVHKSKQKMFGMHGRGVLGGTPVYAERMGREIVSNSGIVSSSATWSSIRISII